jgi:hypothetical protein
MTLIGLLIEIGGRLGFATKEEVAEGTDEVGKNDKQDPDRLGHVGEPFIINAIDEHPDPENGASDNEKSNEQDK